MFVACRVLSTKPEQHDYVIFRVSDVARRLDVEVASTPFKTEAEAEAEIKRLGGAIPGGFAMYLDFWDERAETVWCWKDERTEGASQVFESEQEALDAWDKGELIFEPPPD